MSCCSTYINEFVVKGTTFSAVHTFSSVSAGDITGGCMTIKQKGGAVTAVEIPFSDAVVDATANTVTFTLTQAQSLNLSPGPAMEIFEWLIGTTRGASKPVEFGVLDCGKDEVIS